MDKILKLLFSNGLVRARIKNGITAFSVAAGAWTLSHLYDWLTAHATFFSSSDNMTIAATVASALAALILAVGSAVYTTYIDPANVDAKMVAVAATGDIHAANDPLTVKAAKASSSETSGSQEAVENLTAKLAAGKV